MQLDGAMGQPSEGLQRKITKRRSRNSGNYLELERQGEPVMATIEPLSVPLNVLDECDVCASSGSLLPSVCPQQLDEIVYDNLVINLAWLTVYHYPDNSSAAIWPLKEIFFKQNAHTHTQTERLLWPFLMPY